MIAGLPRELAGLLVESEKGLAFAPARDIDVIALDQRGVGVVPLDVATVEILDDVVLPLLLARIGIEAEQGEV